LLLEVAAAQGLDLFLDLWWQFLADGWTWMIHFEPPSHPAAFLSRISQQARYASMLGMWKRRFPYFAPSALSASERIAPDFRKLKSGVWVMP
jgi:hypothetical protein